MTSIPQYTLDNTDGFSVEDRATLNRIYEHRCDLLDEEQRDNGSLLQHISEEVFRDYDYAQPHIPRVIRVGIDQLRVTDVLDVWIIPAEQGSVPLAVMALVDLEGGDLQEVLLVIYPDGEIITQRDLQSPTHEIPENLGEIDWPPGVVVCDDGLPRYLPGLGVV